MTTESNHSNLGRGLLASAIIHAFGVAFALGRFEPELRTEAVVVEQTVDVEIAPAPPKAEAPFAEVAAVAARPPARDNAASNSLDSPDERSAAAALRDAGVDEAVDAGVDEAVDAGVDAAPRKRRRPPPTSDAGVTAAPPDGPSNDGAEPGDAGPVVLAGESAPNNVDPVPAFVGTTANLLAYFPPGQVVTALVRFDRLRGTEWASAAEALLRPMPDYRALFGSRDANINGKLDLLAISSSRPQDATATTLAMKTHLSRGDVRQFLGNPSAPIAWSASRGGLLGKRGSGRVLLSPWRQWYLLASPDDLPGLLTSAKGELDTVEATAKLPAWLSSIRAVEGESGRDARGPALVVTLGRPRSGPGAVTSGRYSLPKLGLGVASLPAPVKVSVAMELVKQGWLVRGTMRFSTAAEASEFVSSARDVRHRVLDSLVLSAIAARQHARNALEGLSLLRSGSGVSFATSLSISDARAVLASVAEILASHFAQP